ncbi:hypothetical protein [Yersinia bercovieri]|uniref:hypothetical protein n=1 Tax=Yersinia bercovieri TaxID=634 RepID=UPI0011A140C5|nr:hypothetical protein [Yersinia bercovieri]
MKNPTGNKIGHHHDLHHIKSGRVDKNRIINTKSDGAVFYHYTNRDGYANILGDMAIRSSNKDERGIVHRGWSRIYLTDITPDIVFRNPRANAIAIFGNTPYQSAVNKMSHYISVQDGSTGYEIIRATGHVYYIQNLVFLSRRFWGRHGRVADFNHGL